jgi:sigma-B regulation protein RsbU (phosphoserine phosphatase)
MRILVGWEDTSEAETIGALLEVDVNQAQVFTDAAEFEAAAKGGGWQVILMSLDFPNVAESLALFERVQAYDTCVPIIGAWRQGEIVELAKFISHGLHSHLMRDAGGDFIFLLTSMAEAAYSAVLAQRAKLLAERLREELDSVRRLQESVIPRDLPVPNGYRIAARYEPAQIRVVGSRPVTMAGGDYYDVFALQDESLVLLVGDASGHGVKACMSIMTMHTLIRMIRSGSYPDTADFVAQVNRGLCSNDIVQDEGGFITLLYSTLNLKDHCLQWTAAGAPIPLLQMLDSNDVIQLGDDDTGGLPLAIDDDWEYDGVTTKLPVNSRLLIYTDGLEEAFPNHGEGDQQFGLEGIIASLKSTVDVPLEDALEKLFSDSNAFTKGSGRMDDTSVLLLERKA